MSLDYGAGAAAGQTTSRVKETSGTPVVTCNATPRPDAVLELARRTSLARLGTSIGLKLSAIASVACALARLVLVRARGAVCARRLPCQMLEGPNEAIGAPRFIARGGLLRACRAVRARTVCIFQRRT